MEITMQYKNLSDAEKVSFDDYISEKTGKVEKLLTKFSEDGVLLKISIEKFDKHDAYAVEWHLALPSKKLIASEASHTITKAVDLSKDRLLEQLKKHLAQLRKESDNSSIRG